MKKIICELCKGTEFTKDGGMFVCNTCGTKYTAEEAKGMMKEVEGENAVPVEGAPAEKSNQQQLENILFLANSACEAKNYAETEKFCNQAIVLDSKCWKAWLLKGKAVGWQSEIDNLRIEEAAVSFDNAINYSPKEEKKIVRKGAVAEIKLLGIALASLHMNRFSKIPSSEELDRFSSDQKAIKKALAKMGCFSDMIDHNYDKTIASLIGATGAAAIDNIRAAWSGIEYPNNKDFFAYVDHMGNCASLIRESIYLSENADEDGEAIINRYKNLIIALKEPIDKCSYKHVWREWAGKYIYEKDQLLADAAVALRNSEIAQCRKKIAAIKKKKKDAEEAERKKAEEEKKQRIEAYWAAHKDKKDNLDAEKKELSENNDNLLVETANLNDKIKALQSDAEAKVPTEIEADKLIEQKRELQKCRENLGIFAFKKKKQLSEEIADLYDKISVLNEKAKKEKMAKKAEIDKEIASLEAKEEEIYKECSKIEKRILKIETEFTKDPGSPQKA